VNHLGSSAALADNFTSHYSGRRVLVTGHTGFVGSWLVAWLSDLGAAVMGLSLPEDPDGAAGSNRRPGVREIAGDVREPPTFERWVADFDPEVVFHLAAQALVIPSYNEPLWTLETNVLGTAYVLDSLRRSRSVRSCVVITSDKCYATRPGAHSENDPLGGDDPYSASKAAAEIVAHAYRESFLASKGVGVATARAGNILGGGDFAKYRVIPDCIRAIEAGIPVELRHPNAVRPWQHVLDAVTGYLQLGAALMDDPVRFAQAWNFGPPKNEATSVDSLVRQFLTDWRNRGGDACEQVHTGDGAFGERETLILDSSKAQTMLGWSPLLNVSQTIGWTAEWYYEVFEHREAAAAATSHQIARYMGLERELARSGSLRGEEM
jgi:CDP-glucose 4,6-dehydratase